MGQTPQRLLLKLLPHPGFATPSVRANLWPLFDTSANGRAASELALESGRPAWYLANLTNMEANPWDSAHSRVGDALGIDHSAILFAEPDLPQSYLDRNEVNPGGSAQALKKQSCDPKPQCKDQRPAGPGFAWHLRDEYSQLSSARASVSFSDPDRTRIAHIDTGYDASHCARPARLLLDLQRNFVAADHNPNNATDPDRNRLFDTSGHGTGTAGILAGSKVAQNNGEFLGGAPDADILPVRIANSVVLFYTSTFAQGINYALQQNCDVVSISMGGLPSAAWNETVNHAYLAGMCIVAASGDCFGGLPSHHVVYPARYHRTLAACGVMANGQPYFNLPLDVLEGSWGPASCMSSALAAYTPNTSWARFGCPQTIDMDGAGTSSATPQIAAAVALWYEKYKTQLPRDWRRVEAVRNALFRSAKNADPCYFGKGILQARAALDVTPQLDLPQTPPDDDSLPFLRVITGRAISAATPRERMLDLELCQRYLRNRELQTAVPDPAVAPSKEKLREFLDAVIEDKGASNTLRKEMSVRYLALVGALAT
ncbi:MAG: S8/S53 family peptidase [Acidobacteriaceae bacterium]|nr:S8/S53 family peptidase [Acidobacteriaceae bacterium]